MKRIAGVGSNVLISETGLFDSEIHHARLVTGETYGTPPTVPDRKSIGGLFGSVLQKTSSDVIPHIHHARIVSGELTKYPLNRSVTEKENFYRMLLSEWDSLEELLAEDAFTIAEVTSHTDALPGINTKALVEFTDAAPGIGDMEFFYERIPGVVQLSGTFIKNDNDVAWTRANIVKTYPLLHGVDYVYNDETFSFSILNGSILFAPGVVLQMEYPPVDATELMENDFYAKKVLELAPIHYYPVLDNNSANVADFGSIPINGVIGGYQGANALGDTSIEAPVRKYRESSIGFAVNRATICQVSFPSDKSFDQLFDAGRSGTLVFWMREHVLTTYNIAIGSLSDPYAGRAFWRFYSGTFSSPTHTTNDLSVPGYANYNYIPKCIAIKRTITGTVKVFVNGTWTEAPPTFNVNIPVNSTGGQFKFPAFFDWNYYGIRGVVSDVAMFDRALSDHEIETLYNIGRLD